jgi:flagellar biosynthetic protein FliR
MVTLTEAQVLAWVAPLLWPLLRLLGLFAVAPVLSSRALPVRVRVGLALLVAVAAQPALPAMPAPPLDSPAALAMVLQQVVTGLAIGFAARIAFAAVEFAGELIGLQMGLNFAGFFDPSTGSQGTVTARFLATLATWLFVVIDGHLLLVALVVSSFERFPVDGHPLAITDRLQPHRWGAEIFRHGLWLALPTLAVLTFVNLALGVISRVAQQLQVFSVGFAVTVSVGLAGLMLTLPAMQGPLTALMERMLAIMR